MLVEWIWQYIYFLVIWGHSTSPPSSGWGHSPGNQSEAAGDGAPVQPGAVHLSAAAAAELSEAAGGGYVAAPAYGNYLRWFLKTKEFWSIVLFFQERERQRSDWTGPRPPSACRRNWRFARRRRREAWRSSCRRSGPVSRPQSPKPEGCK